VGTSSLAATQCDNGSKPTHAKVSCGEDLLDRLLGSVVDHVTEGSGDLVRADDVLAVMRPFVMDETVLQSFRLHALALLEPVSGCSADATAVVRAGSYGLEPIRGDRASYFYTRWK